MIKTENRFVNVGEEKNETQTEFQETKTRKIGNEMHLFCFYLDVISDHQQSQARTHKLGIVDELSCWPFD